MPVTDPIQQLQEVSMRLLRRLADRPTRYLFGTYSAASRQRVGQSPETLFIDPAAAPTGIHVTCFHGGEVRTHDTADIDTVRELRRQCDRIWLDLSGFADDDLIRALAAEFRLGALTLADLVNSGNRIKLEQGDEHHVIITQMPHLQPEAGQPEIATLGLVLGHNWLLTFRARPGPVLQPVHERLQRPGSRLRTEPLDYLAYALLDLAVDSYLPIVETLADRLDGLEDAVMSGRGHAALPEIHRQRRALISLGRLFWRQRDLVARLLRDEAVFRSTTQVYLRDVYERTVQLLDMTETTRELAASLIEIHLSLSANRSNQIMQTLTVVASIFIPLTFIAGVYGMNFEHMPELVWRWGYPAVLVLMLVVALVMLAWFRHRGWIGAAEDQAPAEPEQGAQRDR